ncbi:hypothetical protein AB1Y20_017896 [Prymnesium parvum]|uniref:Thioredoxin domain-containing protein n=1 Tax=Prymnesium parvum TaxID=97485 RepID=A0AB34JQP1_PRYPA|mmetsp:Transcript_9900/g.14809  ORF Transcript_9900/g.14809 Transcript_9900/m.14809 type:complete len:231 (+) Transcript_9900:17-709(+)
MLWTPLLLALLPSPRWAGGRLRPAPLGARMVDELHGRDEFVGALTAPPDGKVALSVVCFTSHVCRKCRAFSPRFERLAVLGLNHTSDCDTRFYRVNSLANLELFDSEGVEQLPTVAIYVDGQKTHALPVGKEIGAAAAEVAALVAELQAQPGEELRAQAECVAASTGEPERSTEILFGVLATGGAFARFLAAMGEFGVASEMVPTGATFAECLVECTADMELGGLESFGP